MNITNLTGVNAYRRNASVQLQKTMRQTGGAPSAARTRDRVELSYEDVLRAEHEGYIEVNGNRFAVTSDMASQMRRAYEEMRSRNEAKAARQAAEANARAARQQTQAARDEAKAMQQAMEIARRIAKGGHVPSQDEEFLMNYSQEMYLSAKMMAVMAKEHEKYDTVLEEEEENAEAEAAGGADDTRAAVMVSLSDDAVSSVSVGETAAAVEAK